ncbi:flagellar brake protein [Niveibacterium sp. 24ML]|uniref:flagellar brake protein n=1 Tax=Niveibacterium sp. 24ML TaxID=2985512 RepID=UPI002271C4D8|nr:flagellar brake protein [Niveibacterium sp. 24ML]MCX9156142.1 flagellar brake protein [Niveibacterium sp. 24ML]
MSNTDPVRFELLAADNEYSQYLVRDPREIRFVMKQLAAKRSLISAYPDTSPHFGLTSIIVPDANNNELVLDVAADPDINAALTAAESVNCITQLDRVKVQFQLVSMRPITHGGAPAFAAPLPDVLLRLQRREYFRLLAPVSHTMSCFIPLPGGAGFHEARVLDISGGGLAIVAPPIDAKLHPDMEIPNCRLEIPDTAPIQTTLRVRNIFRVTQRNGSELLRAGCQFVGLTPANENVIHRYILKVERDRASRVSQ